jgi:hypothetical protein
VEELTDIPDDQKIQKDYPDTRRTQRDVLGDQKPWRTRKATKTYQVHARPRLNTY